MKELSPPPKEGMIYPFFANDQIKRETCYRARVDKVIPIQESSSLHIYKYDSYFEQVIPYPIMDLWIEALSDIFWILDTETDYILRLCVPGLSSFDIYAARTVDGGWHSFETMGSNQFGILKVCDYTKCDLCKDLMCKLK